MIEFFQKLSDVLEKAPEFPPETQGFVENFKLVVDRINATFPEPTEAEAIAQFNQLLADRRSERASS